MEVIVRIIGERIEDRGMTITAVAKRAGMSADLLSKTLGGKRRLKADELVNLCQVLDLSISDLRQPA